MTAPKNWSDVNGTAHLTALHRSFPEAGDGRPLPPMGDELMTAGLNTDDARFVAVQLAQNGYRLVLDTDLDAHIGAALAEAAKIAYPYDPEAQPVNAAGPAEKALRRIAKEIRALRKDALTERDRAKREARVEALTEALGAIPSGWAGQPHRSNMDFGPNVSSQAKRAIRATTHHPCT